MSDANPNAHRATPIQSDHYRDAGHDRACHHAGALSLDRYRGSYRTIQRWFQTVIPWVQVFVYFFRQHLFHPQEVYILAGDEVVLAKAGKHTFGLDRFFSSLQQRVVPGLCCFALSVVGITERVAFPLYVEQVIRTEAEKAAQKIKAAHQQAQATIDQRKPGRPMLSILSAESE